MADDAVPGCRVKVRFAGQEVGGYLLARAAETDHHGRLAPLRRVVSRRAGAQPGGGRPRGRSSPSGTPARAATCSASPCRRGTRPPSGPHRPSRRCRPPSTPRRPPAAWAEHPQGEAFLRRLAAGEYAARRVGHAAGGGLAAPARPRRGGDVRRVRPRRPALRARRQGRRPRGRRPERGPRSRSARRADRASRARPGATATSWPSRAASRRVVVGTRAAAFAPVRDLGLVVIWDDGDDLHAEPRAPYAHARETLLVRAEREGTAALLAGFARSVEADQLLQSGWAHELSVPREALRERVSVQVAGASDAELARDPFARGVAVPEAASRGRRATACRPARCSCRRPGWGTPPRWPASAAAPPPGAPCAPGPLAIPDRAARRRGAGGAGPATRSGPARCAGTAACARRSWATLRTAEELGRTFPSTTVRTSSSGQTVLAEVGPKPAIVVATPGRRAGGRGRVRRRRAARHLADARPSRPPDRARRPSAAGPTPSGWSGPAAVRSSSATRRCPASRPWCAGTRAASPPARPPSGPARTCRPPPGWPPSPASRGRSTTR